MKCNDYRQLASAHLDGQATAEEAQPLDLHLAECEACSRSGRAVRAIDSALSGDAPVVSAGFRAALFERLDEEKLLPPQRKGWVIAFPVWRWAGVPLAVAAGLALFLLVGREVNVQPPGGMPAQQQVGRQDIPAAPHAAVGVLPALSPEETEIVANLDLFEDTASFDDAPSGLDDLLAAPPSEGRG